VITEKQRKARLEFIGSSDAAAVLGLSRWATPLSCWAEKVGEIVPEEEEENLRLEVGNELEDLVCKLFTKRTGKKVHRVKETQFHPSYPFIGANLDRRVVGENALLEAKTTSAWNAKSWEGEDIPQEYIVQVLHQLAVTGKERGYIACLIGGNQDFRWKVVERDEKMIAEILKREVSFWMDFVQARVMPTTITKSDGDILAQLFPMSEGEADPIPLGEDANLLVDNIKAQESDYKMLDGQIKADKNRLKVLLKDQPVGVTDRFKITWKDQVAKRVDTLKLKNDHEEIYRKCTKESKSRVLRIMELKGD